MCACSTHLFECKVAGLVELIKQLRGLLCLCLGALFSLVRLLFLLRLWLLRLLRSSPLPFLYTLEGAQELCLVWVEKGTRQGLGSDHGSFRLFHHSSAHLVGGHPRLLGCSLQALLEGAVRL